MTTSEQVALGLRLEALERPKAEERQAEGRAVRWASESDRLMSNDINQDKPVRSVTHRGRIIDDTGQVPRR